MTRLHDFYWTRQLGRIARAFPSSWVLLVALASTSIAAPASVYHSPNDDGAPPPTGQSEIGPTYQSALAIYIDGGSTPSTTTACVNGDGEDLCGYDVMLRARGGVSVLDFIPAPGVKCGLTPGAVRCNGGNFYTGTLGPDKLGDLVVAADGEGDLYVGSGRAVRSNQQAESFSGDLLFTVPEPHMALALALGFLLLALAAPRTRRAVASSTRTAALFAFATACTLALPHSASAQQIVGPLRTLTLDELGVSITREKQFDVNTGSAMIYSEMEDPVTGEIIPLAEPEVDILRDQDRAAYRANKGAISPGLYAKVQSALANAPTTPIQIAAMAMIPPGTFPPGMTFAESNALTDEESDALGQLRTTEISGLLAPHLSALASEIALEGGVNVQYSSTSPLVYAELLPADVMNLANSLGIVGMLFDANVTIEEEMLTSTCTTNATPVQNLGVNATNLEIAIVEGQQVDNPSACIDVDAVYGDGEIASHPTAVAATAASTMMNLNGMAPGANILSGDFDQYISITAEIEDTINWARANGADVVNMSFKSDDSGQVESEDIEVDIQSAVHRRLMVKSAGNTNTCGSNRVTSPGLGFNTLTVGNHRESPSGSRTCGTSDDSISATSCWVDPWSPMGDRNKPEMSAPGTSITMADINCGTRSASGTSIAAPHVSGAAALLIARNTGMKDWPELLKAILMASALNRIGGANVDRAGVGGLDALAADTISRAATFSTVNASSSSFDSNKERVVGSFQSEPGLQRVKIALVWGHFPDWNNWVEPTDDLDLLVYRTWQGNRTLEFVSDSYDNAYETLDFAPQSRGFYEIVAKRWAGGRLDGDSVPVAAAWSLVNPCVGLGGDWDGDGACGDTDNCFYDANTDQADQDGDGFGDVCDNCPSKDNGPLEGTCTAGDPLLIDTGCLLDSQCGAGSDAFCSTNQEDNEPDGQGDACDDDDDNDGCKDKDDEDPLDRTERDGWVLAVNCSKSGWDHRGFAGIHSDSDGDLNCQDPDNDDDGIPDAQDLCPNIPLQPGNPNTAVACTKVVTCPFTTIWGDFCRIQDCFEFGLKIYELINPDPTEIWIPAFSVLNETLYLRPAIGQGLGELAQNIGLNVSAPMQAMASGFAAPMGAGAAGGEWVVEIWSKDANGDPVAFQSEAAIYYPDSVVLGQLDMGKLLAIVPEDTEQGLPMAAYATWAEGVEEDTELPDFDDDGWPDAFDNCETTANSGQKDSASVSVGALPDGDGDDCQCADVDDSGEGDLLDVFRMARYLAFGEALAAPQKCSVIGGPDDCTDEDLDRLREDLAGNGAIVEQVCSAAN